MSGWLDTSLVILIVVFMALLIWSRVQNQKMLDTIVEIKDIIKAIGGKKD